MAITVTNLGQLILGKKLSLCPQFTVGGHEYVVAAYYKFSKVPCTPIYVVWNLTDNTVTAINGSVGGEDAIQLGTDLLDSGRLATTNRSYYMEFDLHAGTLAFSRQLSGSPVDMDHNMRQGVNGKVVVTGGTDHTNMWLEWCDQGGANWVSQKLTIPTADKWFRSPCSMTSGGVVYVYGCQYTANCVICINTTTLVESKITFPGTDGNSTSYLYEVTVGGINKVYAQVFGTGAGWYEIDGTTVTSVSAPSTYYHEQTDNGTITDFWFTSDTIPVSLNNIMPNNDNEVSISYEGGTNVITTVPQDAMIPRIVGLVHPTESYTLVQGADYGPVYKLYLSSLSTPQFAGYCNAQSNAYFFIWNILTSRWAKFGYDKKIEIYDPSQTWTQTPATNDPTTTNPTKQTIPGGFDTIHGSSNYDRFYWPCIGANGYYYFISGGGPFVWWAEIGTSNWSGIDLIDSLGLNDCDVVCIRAINSGNYIAISSVDQDSPGGNWVGRLRLLQVSDNTITKTYTYDSNASSINANIGIIVEVATGHVVAVRGNLSSGCKVWRIDTSQNAGDEVVWTQMISGNAFALNTTGTNEYCDLEVGPNGLVYLYIGTSIYSIDPDDGTLTEEITAAQGAPEGCRLRWIGYNLIAYYGDLNLYQITGLASAYSRGSYLSLPANDDDLTYAYTDDDIADVALEDDIRVSQSVISGNYAIHEFKNDAGSYNSVRLTWEGQTTTAPSDSVVKLQIYNRTTATWVDVATNSVANANEDFTLTDIVDISADYKDANNMISCRVWQQAV